MNFILFQPDEMRAESLGCYGHPVSQTPRMDAFAREATRFEQAHTSHTVCSRDAGSLLASPAVGSDAVSGTADGTIGRGTWELAPVPVPE